MALRLASQILKYKMEPYRRRARNRRRCHSESFASPSAQEEQPRRGFSILGSIQNIFIMASLVALIYMMLDYHCQTCKDNSDLRKITKSIDDIVVNVQSMLSLNQRRPSPSIIKPKSWSKKINKYTHI